MVRRQAVVDRTAMFGATTTSARIEDPAAAGWGRHKYVGMFGTHPDYQQRGIGAAVLVRTPLPALLLLVQQQRSPSSVLLRRRRRG